MVFEEKWAVIEAFIEERAIDADHDVIAAMRELVRYGEVPFLAGPGLGIPAADPELAGPGLGIPAGGNVDLEVPVADPVLAGPGLGIPLVAGPGLGIPASVPGFIVFQTIEDAEEAHESMEELAEEQMLEQ